MVVEFFYLVFWVDIKFDLTKTFKVRMKKIPLSLIMKEKTQHTSLPVSVYRIKHDFDQFVID